MYLYLKQFIIDLLQCNPKDRPCFEKIYRNKWLNKDLDICEDVARTYERAEEKLLMEFQKLDFLIRKDKSNANKTKFKLKKKSEKANKKKKGKKAAKGKDTDEESEKSEYTGDNNSASGLKVEEGQFFKAYTKDHKILLDEINLAPREVLECIEQALDSKKYSKRK